MIKGLRFAHVNASPESLWKWFSFRRREEAIEVELRLPTRPELAELNRKYGQDNERMADFIAEHWFRDFRGPENTAGGREPILDAKGDELQNTIPVRRALLNDLDL